MAHRAVLPKRISHGGIGPCRPTVTNQETRPKFSSKTFCTSPDPCDFKSKPARGLLNGPQRSEGFKKSNHPAGFTTYIWIMVGRDRRARRDSGNSDIMKAQDEPNPPHLRFTISPQDIASPQNEPVFPRHDFMQPRKDIIPWKTKHVPPRHGFISRRNDIILRQNDVILLRSEFVSPESEFMLA